MTTPPADAVLGGQVQGAEDPSLQRPQLDQRSGRPVRDPAVERVWATEGQRIHGECSAGN